MIAVQDEQKASPLFSGTDVLFEREKPFSFSSSPEGLCSSSDFLFLSWANPK